MSRCGCEDGDICTKTTVCHLESALEDQNSLVHELINAANEYIETVYASTCCPIPIREIILKRDLLKTAVDEHKEWEQDL
jgi:hypothetical protein